MKREAAHPILFAVGINYKTAAIELREKFYIHEAETAALIAELKKTMSEVIVLSTCNRTEIYGVTTRGDLDVDFYKDLLIDFKNARGVARREDFFGYVSCAACHHLFRVATSIDSKVVGDIQILGQMRTAYEKAQAAGATGKIVNQLFQRSFKVGKTARTETRLHKGAVSISSAAVELAAKTFGSLAEKTVMIVGAGDTARLTAECLLKNRVRRLLITNRTRAHAEKLLADLFAADYDFAGEVLDFADFKNHLNRAVILISSTSAPDAILEKADFAAQERKILLIDIAVPRDIAPDVAENEHVLLKNIDDLNAIVDRNYQRRMEDLPAVNRLISAEISDFLVWYYSLPLLPPTRPGAKPDPATLREIVRVKEFLTAHFAELHQLAMRHGADSFNGHLEIVDRLLAMKEKAAPVGSGQWSVGGGQ